MNKRFLIILTICLSMTAAARFGTLGCGGSGGTSELPQTKVFPDPDINNLSAIWVSATEGDDSNDGSISKPMASISSGILKAIANGTSDIYVVKGDYYEDVLITNNINLYGGYSLLTNDLRTRDITANETSIRGKTGIKNKIFLFGTKNITIDYSLSVDSSNSIIDGFSVYGDHTYAVDNFGIGVLLNNSNASLRNSKIIEATPAADRDTNIAIAVIAGSTLTEDKVVNIQYNEITMKGTNSYSTGSDFGITALPEKGATKGISLNVTNNVINNESKSMVAYGVAVADNNVANFNLKANDNSITMDCQSKGCVGILGGSSNIGIGPDDSIYLNNFEASRNKITMTSGSLGQPSEIVTMVVGAVRGTSLLDNNVIDIDSHDAAMLGLMLSNAAANVYNNTFSIKGVGESMDIFCMGFFLDFKNTNPNLPNSTPGNIANNIIDIQCNKISTPECHAVSIGEFADDAFKASPVSVRNNLFNLPTNCGEWGLYMDKHDTPYHYVTDINKLNDKSGLFDPVNDPTIFENNITGDPLFVSDGSYQLSASSPAINAGISVTEVTTDILGLASPQGTAFDIGAYEQ